MCDFVLYPFSIQFFPGSLHWKCVLAHDVIAEDCLCKQTQKRIELRMKKAAAFTWMHFESAEKSFADDASESSDSYDSASAIFGPTPSDNTGTGSLPVSDSNNDLGMGSERADKNASGRSGLDNCSNSSPDLNSSVSTNQKQVFGSSGDPASDPVPAKPSGASGSDVGVRSGGDGTKLENSMAEDSRHGVSVCGVTVCGVGVCGVGGESVCVHVW